MLSLSPADRCGRQGGTQACPSLGLGAQPSWWPLVELRCIRSSEGEARGHWRFPRACLCSRRNLRNLGCALPPEPSVDTPFLQAPLIEGGSTGQVTGDSRATGFPPANWGSNAPTTVLGDLHTSVCLSPSGPGGAAPSTGSPSVCFPVVTPVWPPADTIVWAPPGLGPGLPHSRQPPGQVGALGPACAQHGLVGVPPGKGGAGLLSPPRWASCPFSQHSARPRSLVRPGLGCE